MFKREMKKVESIDSSTKDKKSMACFVPFNGRNLDISFFAFRPTIVLVDDLIEVLKCFISSTSRFGCVYSAIFRSLHGNLIIWYGAWIKRSDEDKESLNAALLSMLHNVSNMAILLDHNFFEAYAGQSRDGTSAAKFSAGDIVSMYSASLTSDDNQLSDKLSYAALAIFRSNFSKMKGSSSGVCLKSQGLPRVLGFCVWKSLQFCYTYLLNTDYRETVLPYVDGFPLEIKYDIFKVEHVSAENNLNSYELCPPCKVLHNDVESKCS